MMTLKTTEQHLHWSQCWCQCCCSAVKKHVGADSTVL
jgi:hypothetical protein